MDHERHPSLAFHIHTILSAVMLTNMLSMAVPVNLAARAQISTAATIFDSPLAPPTAPVTTFDSPLPPPPIDEISSTTMQTWASPVLAMPGDIVTINVVVDNTDEVISDQDTFTALLPPGLDYVTESALQAQYSPEDHALRWAVQTIAPQDVLTWTYQVRVPANAAAGVREWRLERSTSATDAETETTIARGWLSVGETATATISPEGSTLSLPGGQVTLDVPPRAVTEETVVQIATYPSPVGVTDGRHWRTFFDLRAVGEVESAIREADGHINFLKPFTMTLQFGGRSGSMMPYLLHFEDPAGRVMTPIPSQYDPETGALTASLQRFSGFAAGEDPFRTDGEHFLFAGEPSVSLYSGSANYFLPIEAPAGPGGLGPSLGLAYNNRSLDGVLGVVQSPNVGSGWSLAGVPSIVRNITTYQAQGDTGEETMWEYYSQFTLHIGGTSYRLVEGEVLGNGGGCRYYTQETSGLRVMRYGVYHGTTFCGYGNEAQPAGIGTTHSGEYWIVTTPDGTRYRFGFDAQSEQLALMVGYSEDKFPTLDYHFTGNWKNFHGYAGELEHRIAYRWRITDVEDTHGNRMEFGYAEETRVPPNYPVYDRASHLAYVRYGGNTTTGAPMRYRIDVIHESRGVHDDGPPEYLIQYYTMWDDYRIHAFRVCAGQGWSACTDPNNQIIREYVLDYDFPTLPWPGYEWVHHDYPPEITRLVGVRQYGLGGVAGYQQLPRVEFSYTNLDQADNVLDPTDNGGYGGKLQYPRLTRVDNGYGGWVTFSYEARPYGHVYSYRVLTREWGDGIGTGNDGQASYTYGTACFLDYISECRRGNLQVNGILVGHDWTTETITDLSTTTTLAQTKHYFHNDASEALGREYQTEVTDPQAGLLQTGTQTWSVTPNYDGVTGRYRIELSSSGTCMGSSCAGTGYTHDEYGNVTRVTQYGDTSLSGDETTVEREYVYNITDWIINRPSLESIVTASGIIATQTRTAYDDQAWGAAPTQGSPTQVKSGLGSWGWITATTVYNGLGNPTSVTDPLGHVTQTGYDPIYDQYPIVATNALTQTTYAQWDTTLGVPHIITDANGAVTEYAYDDFGRLESVTRPGESAPVVQYTYPSGSSLTAPYMVLTERRVDSYEATPIYHRSWTFYDGLGRMIQTQAETETANEVVVGSQAYDALGRTVKTTSPYTAASAGGTYLTPNWSTLDKTVTQYDALGRGTQVVAPDGATTQHAYQGWKEMVLDANGHQTEYEMNGLGQLVAVREYYGTYTIPTWNPAETPAETCYWYDVLSNLTHVLDAEGNVTQMTYDPLGRKVEMLDPSMGHWEYVYDAAGNLVAQTDALSQTLAFSYDALNRLIEKRVQGGSVLAAFGYDSGTWGIGHRTVMTDATGMTTWEYDALGRMTEESRTLTGIGVYTTGFSYNAADQVVQMVYPDGEIVETTYNLRGLPTGLEGDDDYLTSATYNVMGQPLQQTWGIGHATIYAYDAETFRLTQLQVTGGFLNLSYGYDQVGNITSITDAVNNGQIQSFTYDARDRLVTGETTSVGDGQYDATYDYSLMGNVLTRTVDGTAQGYTYGETEEITHGLQLQPRMYLPLIMSSGSSGYPSSPNPTTGQPFAVLSLSVGSQFTYNANGNMTARVEGGVTYAQQFDVENRLVAVTNTSTGDVTQFFYDGDGNRVLQAHTSGGYTFRTVYIGNYYEVKLAPLIPNTVRKYYYLGGRRVAVRVDNGSTTTVYYLHTDHLGSTSLATYYNGSSVVEMPGSRTGYYPYGEVRYGGALPTDYTYTGQYYNSYTQISLMGARWYNGNIGRWISPDTIVPDPTNPQSLNRYSYVIGNPLRYQDPSGHWYCTGEGCEEYVNQIIGLLRAVGENQGSDSVSYDLYWQFIQYDRQLMLEQVANGETPLGVYFEFGKDKIATNGTQWIEFSIEAGDWSPENILPHFAHELTHLLHPEDTVAIGNRYILPSIRGEVRAFQTGYNIADEYRNMRGWTNREFREYLERAGMAYWVYQGFEGVRNDDNRFMNLDLNSRSDLKVAYDMITSWESGSTYQFYLHPLW